MAGFKLGKCNSFCLKHGKLLRPAPYFKLMKYLKEVRDESKVNDEELSQRGNYLAC